MSTKNHVKGLTEMAVGEMQRVVGMCLGPPLHYCYAVTVANMRAKACIQYGYDAQLCEE